MSCAKGCCETQRDHYRSLVVAGALLSVTNDGMLDTYAKAREAGLQPPSVPLAGPMLKAVGG